MFLLPIKNLQSAGQQIKTKQDFSGILVHKYLAQTNLAFNNLKP